MIIINLKKIFYCLVILNLSFNHKAALGATFNCSQALLGVQSSLELKDPFPQHFVSRSGANFELKETIQSLYFNTDPINKFKYQSGSHVLWLVSLETKTRRYFWELKQTQVPRMYFEPGLKNSEIDEVQFKWESELDSEGFLHVGVQTRDGQGRYSELLNAKNLYVTTVKYFGATRVKGIATKWPSDWELSDNLTAFNHWTAVPQNMKPEDAVWLTHEGRQAKQLGFTVVSFPADFATQFKTRIPGQYTDVRVIFSRP